MRIFLLYYIASLHCLISITLYTALHVLIQNCCENYFLLHSICVFTTIVHVLSSESILKNRAIYQVFCHITQLFKLKFLQHYLPQTCTYTKFVGISWKPFYDVEMQSFLTSACKFFCEYVYDVNSLLAFWQAFWLERHLGASCHARRPRSAAGLSEPLRSTNIKLEPGTWKPGQRGGGGPGRVRCGGSRARSRRGLGP